MTPDYVLHHDDMFQVMPSLPDGEAALVFADLPYATAQRQSTAHAWDRPFPLDAAWPQFRRIGRPNAVFVFTAIQPFASELVLSNRKAFRYDLILHKSSPVGFFNANRQPMRAHEHVLIFYARPPNYSPQFTKGAKPYGAVLRKGSNSNYGKVAPNQRPANTGTRHPTSVLAVKSEGRTISKHPTQKPVALLQWLIATYTLPGDLIFDPSFGSNTTGVACARLGRRYIGIEKDSEYFRIGKERLEAEHEQLRTPPAQGRLAI